MINLVLYQHGTAWSAWRAKTTHAIASAAGRHDDSALEWVMKIETHEALGLETQATAGLPSTATWRPQ